MNFVEYQTFVEYQKLKSKNVNKLWQKLSIMSINTGLDIKTRLD